MLARLCKYEHFTIGGVNIMKSLIVYCSSYGTTKKAAQLIKKHLTGEVELVNLENVTNLQITDGFETVIIGSSIQLGQIHKKIKMFVDENVNQLLQKNLGLFVCCLKDEAAELQLNNNLPIEIRNHANTAIFGGEIVFSKLTLFEKLVVKNIAGIKEDTFTLNEQAIKDFALRMNENTNLVNS